jgi:hypothetical protein
MKTDPFAKQAENQRQISKILAQSERRQTRNSPATAVLMPVVYEEEPVITRGNAASESLMSGTIISRYGLRERPAYPNSCALTATAMAA